MNVLNCILPAFQLSIDRCAFIHFSFRFTPFLLFRSLSEEEANDRFDEVDENNDDIVTWSEYLREMYDMDTEDEPGIKMPVFDENSDDMNKQLIEDDKIVFETADLNKDGHLTRDEFVLFISPEEHPIMLPIILNQTLRDKDTDHDGVINFQEFLGDSARDHDKAWLIAEKERFDSEHDKDGDGLLNGNEILSWIVPSNEYAQSMIFNNIYNSKIIYFIWFYAVM